MFLKVLRQWHMNLSGYIYHRTFTLLDIGLVCIYKACPTSDRPMHGMDMNGSPYVSGSVVRVYA